MPHLASLILRASPSGTFNGTPPDHLPAENGVHVWRTAVGMPFVTFAFVALRFYTKTYILRARKYTVDDCKSLSYTNVLTYLSTYTT